MAGAENIDPTQNVLMAALVGSFPRSGTVTYSFAPAGTPVDRSTYSGGSDFTEAWTASEMAAFRAVMAEFEAVANLTIREVPYGTSADIELQMVASVPGGSAGYAGGGTFVVGSASVGLLTHEFGHSMNLGHPFDTSFGTSILPGVSGPYDSGDFDLNSDLYSVMAYNAGRFHEFANIMVAQPTNLMALDIAALQILYGANTSTRSGNDTYGPSSGFKSIWDTGGIDTIDFSGVKTDTAINLNAATLQVGPGGGGWASLVNAQTDADFNSRMGGYTIAYGVEIENGTGGDGNDVITGNGLNNVLKGNLGNDKLIGNGGNDTIYGGDGSAALPETDMARLNVSGDTDRYLEVSNFSGFPANFTLDLVVRIDAGVSGRQRLLAFDPDDPNGLTFDLEVWSDDFPQLYLIEKNGSSLSTVFTGISKAEIADGELHRLTISRDSTTGEMKFYLDGKLEGSGTVAPGQTMAGTGTLVFGQSLGVWGGAFAADRALYGSFGDIALHTGVLTDADIAARDLTNLANPAETSLANFWRFDAATDRASDLAGNATMTLRGGATVSTVPLREDDDTIVGGGGDDVLHGGPGSDTVIVAGTSSAVTVSQLSAGLLVSGTDGADTIMDDVEFIQFDDKTLSYAQLAALVGSMPVIRGTSNSEPILGTSGSETILGLGGNDWITPGAGSDDVDGGDGVDMVSFVDLGQAVIVDLSAGTA
ncbi:hypothetical protein DXV76_21100, partial [Rhodobacteraceae bacterium CCMM004]